MSKKLELALEVLAENGHEEYYHLMVCNLTSNAIHAAKYISTTDFATLEKFVKDVKILQEWNKEK